MESCRDVLDAIKALGGKNCSYQTLADKLGVSTTTYSFKAKISSSKQYGFIENFRSIIQLSERGKLLIYPTQNVNEKEILLGCFQNPTLYVKIIQNFLGKPLPSVEHLSNELMKPYYGMTATGKNIAADCFIKNAEYIGALQNGILTFDNILDSGASSTEDDIVTNLENGATPTSDNNISMASNGSSGMQHYVSPVTAGYRFQIPMLSGKNAEIYLPDDISETDIDFFQRYVEAMLPLFMDNLRKKISKGTAAE